MSSQHPHSVGFFPNLLSVLIFTIIMGGMFLGFTRIYSQYIQQYQLAQQPTDTITEPTVSEEIAPFVRGILSGISLSQSMSTRSDEPLNANEIKGFQEGIKAALLASKNWYNIDQQLFRTRGIALGVKAAEDMSKTNRDRGTQAYQVKLIQQIETAIAVNLDELLTSNDDRREQVLSDYLNNLKKLAGEAAIEMANMERIIEGARSDVNLQTGIAEEYDQNFIYNLEPTDDKNIESYLRARNKIDESTVVIQSTGQLLNRLGPAAIRLNQLIAAIESNFAALSTGTRVTPVQGVNLPIFQEQ